MRVLLFSDFDVLVGPETRLFYARVGGVSFAAAAVMLHCSLVFANGGSAQDSTAVVLVTGANSSGSSGSNSTFVCKLPPTGACTSVTRHSLALDHLHGVKHSSKGITRAFPSGSWSSYVKSSCTVASRQAMPVVSAGSLADVVRDMLCCCRGCCC
jgi:hypothetical protein